MSAAACQHVAKGYRFQRAGRMVDVATAGYLDAGKTVRVIGLDSAGAYWLLDIGSQGQLLSTIVGPVTIDDALATAEAIISGHHHGSVAEATTTLALAVVGHVLREAA